MNTEGVAHQEPTCRFDLAWVGPCGKASVRDGLCEDHLAKRCCICGGQAVRQCGYDHIMVCTAPLCETCEHHP
jgi:hypothetical protein